MQSPVYLVDKIETALRGVLRDAAKVALRGALIALRGRLRLRRLLLKEVTKLKNALIDC